MTEAEKTELARRTALTPPGRTPPSAEHVRLSLALSARKKARWEAWKKANGLA